MRRLFRGVAVAAAAAFAAVLVTAGPASAHVTVNPSEAEQGGDATVSFRVPTESATASTTKIEVQFPTDTPIAVVDVQPKAGWTYSVTTTHLTTPVKSDSGDVTDVVSLITWTGGSIKPGEFDEFDVSLNNLPSNTTSLAFKTIQTYSDGTVVRWIDLAAKGQPEPEHPAPLLTLTKPGASTSTDSSDGTARTLSIIAIVIAVIGAGAAGFALRGRKDTAHTH